MFQTSSSAPSAHPLIGFLRVNRSVLAISATAFAVLAVVIHELPAQVAAQELVNQAIGVQSITVPTAVEQPVDLKRGAFAVSRYTTVQWPVDPASPVASGFGYRVPPCAGCSSFHRGTDIDPGRGTPIAAISDGVVTEVGDPSGSLGVYAIIRHDVDGVIFSSLYGHMELGSLQLAVGQTVTRGQRVGLVGSTGASTGAHLHFGIEDASGTLIDSLEWLRQYANVPYAPAS
ncbi:MAG TPA: M23 family metallopeptidase [Pseudolysinimonas sp.]|nr:M23 family metallopeptidase [Pseudolysinimonas sp.]